MSTKVYELFKTDLDPNSLDWWSVDKIDKINLNFKQFINGGQVGPEGPQGIYGSMGYEGPQGVKGPQGIEGPQGIKGPGITDLWDYYDDHINFNSSYLFPKNTTTTHAVAMYLGEKNIAPYGTELNESTYGVQVPNSVFGSNVTINNRDVEWSQLAISYKLNSGLKTRADFKYTNSNIISINPTIFGEVNRDVIKIGNLINSGSLILSISASQLSISGSILFDQNNLTFIDKTIFNDSVNILVGDTKYPKDADKDFILVSIDNTGDVDWKNTSTVFGSFPVGSIISVRTEEFFNDQYFELDMIMPEDPLLGPLQFIYGRGKTGTKYSGWYLCNGETWNYNGLISYTVPNLNSFNYTIESNEGDQNTINWGDNKSIIIGGFSVYSNSVQRTGEKYETTLVVDENSDIPITLYSQSGDISKNISRNVNIVYLGKSNFTWENSSTTIPPKPLYDIQLAGPFTISELACSSIDVNTFKMNVEITASDWKTFSTIGSGYELYIDRGISANIGWYQNVGTSRYWDGASFTRQATCPAFALLVHSQSVTALNNNILPFEDNPPYITNNDIKYMNNTLFKDTTTLQNSDGSQAIAGWYREVESFNAGAKAGFRRYWNGNKFAGSSFLEDYIRFADNDDKGLFYGVQAGDGLCESGELHKTYYASDNFNYNPSTVGVGDIPYVHLDWVQSDAGLSPLIKVIEQKARMLEISYNKARNNENPPFVFGSISSVSGEFTQIYECPVPVEIRGEQVFTQGGNFIVPDDVYSVSIVAVQKGMPGMMNYWGGEGGAIAWCNNLSVTPGETLSITIETESIVKSGLTTRLSTTGVGADIRYNGGAGGAPTVPGPRGTIGGGEGGYPGNYFGEGLPAEPLVVKEPAELYVEPYYTGGSTYLQGWWFNQGGVNQKTEGVGLFGIEGGDGGYGRFGAGAGGRTLIVYDDGTTKTLGGDSPGPGGVRIIWGEGIREFPNTDCGPL